MDDYKYLFKIVLVGNAGVGKTCIVKRFTQGIFPPGQGATIGVDFMIKTVNVNGFKIKLQIWDTAGQERFRSITQSYYRSAHAIILVYDVTNGASFNSLEQWLTEIKAYASPHVYIALVGNKIDKRIEEREVTSEQAQAFVESQHIPVYIETSAKGSENVNQLFDDLARHLLTATTAATKRDSALVPPQPVNSSLSPRLSGVSLINGRTSLAQDAVIDVYHKRNIRNEIINDAVARTKSSCC